MAIVDGQARYEALLTCSARRVGMYIDASVPLHPLPRHHASRKKVIVEQMSYNCCTIGSLGLSTIHIPPETPQTSYMRSGASVHMTTEQILPLIVVTFIFIDISEL